MLQSNRYVVPSIDVERLEKSYKTEFDYFLSKYYDKNNLEIKSIFFGGGSPSLAPPQFISNIINHINQKVQFASEIEITLEANPTVLFYTSLFSLHGNELNKFDNPSQQKQVRWLNGKRQE